MKSLLFIALAVSLALNGFLLLRSNFPVIEGRTSQVKSVAAATKIPPISGIQASTKPEIVGESEKQVFANAESSSSGPLELIGQRKRIYQAHPEWGLPEFANFSDEVWLDMAESYPADTDEEARASFASMRQIAKQSSKRAILEAVSQFQEKHDGALPESLLQLSSGISDQIVVRNLGLYKYVISSNRPAQAQIIDDRVADKSVDFGVEANSNGHLRVYRIGTLDSVLRLCEDAILRNPNITSTNEVISFSGGDLRDPFLRYHVNLMLRQKGRTRR